MKSIKNIFNRKDTEAPEKRKFTIEEPEAPKKMPMVVEASQDKKRKNRSNKYSYDGVVWIWGSNVSSIHSAK